MGLGLVSCLALLLALSVGACSATPGQSPTPTPAAAQAIRLASPEFADGAAIPIKYTCDGKDVSPALQWSGLPAGTKSLALIADDPDAPGGTFVHWVLYDLPSSASELPEGVAKVETLPNGAKQGTNGARSLGYRGPCPPQGNPHRYFFKLYALDAELGLPPGATKEDLLKAMEGHVLAEGQLMGTYQRR